MEAPFVGVALCKIENSRVMTGACVGVLTYLELQLSQGIGEIN